MNTYKFFALIVLISLLLSACAPRAAVTESARHRQGLPGSARCGYARRGTGGRRNRGV